MFKSIEYLRSDTISGNYIYLLTDSDFEVETGVPGGSSACRAIASRRAAAAIEYDRRKLPVGKNLLLIAKFFEKNNNYEINQAISWQDKYIPFILKEVNYPNYQEKWQQWKKERDEYLVML